jgi:hypothetical protein
MIVNRCFLVLALVLATWSGVQAKGIFQAQGKVIEVRKEESAVAFRFVGWISSGYATAPDAHPKRRWKDMRWDSTDVWVRVGDWTEPNNPDQKADRPDPGAAYATLTEFMNAGQRVQFSIDNPGFFFSNKGQLMRVSGTQIYANEIRK